MKVMSIGSRKASHSASVMRKSARGRAPLTMTRYPPSADAAIVATQTSQAQTRRRLASSIRCVCPRGSAVPQNSHRSAAGASTNRRNVATQLPRSATAAPGLPGRQCCLFGSDIQSLDHNTVEIGRLVDEGRLDLPPQLQCAARFQAEGALNPQPRRRSPYLDQPHPTAEAFEFRPQTFDGFADPLLERFGVKAVQKQNRPHLLVLGQAFGQFFYRLRQT